MAEVVKMPKMSDTMTDGVLAKWHKKVGDQVKTGDLVAEIETDKATMDFESFQEGVLLYIGPKEGESVPVDGIIAILGKSGEDFNLLLNGSAPVAEPVAASSSIPEPIATSTPVAAPVAASAFVASSTPVAAPVAASALVASSTPVAAPVAASAIVASPAPLAVSVSSSAPVASPAPVAVSVSSSAPVVSATDRIKASPLARKLAEEKGIDLAFVNGSTENGRIVKKDIESYLPPIVASAISTPAASIVAPAGSYEDVPVSQMRKVIAKRLSESLFTAPHFYLTMSIRMDKAMELRKQLNEVATVKISFNDMVLKAVAIAIKSNPKVNSSWLGDKIRYNHAVNIGVAVAVEEGLLVPVVRNADSKSLSQISTEVKEFAQKAKDKKLQPSDWEGSTFTISNLGMYGIDEFTAIINTPDACILAIGGIQAVPVVDSGQVVPGNIMKLTLSCDHRVVDGAIGSAFLQTMKELLETPFKILI